MTWVSRRRVKLSPQPATPSSMNDSSRSNMQQPPRPSSSITDTSIRDGEWKNRGTPMQQDGGHPFTSRTDVSMIGPQTAPQEMREHGALTAVTQTSSTSTTVVEAEPADTFETAGDRDTAPKIVYKPRWEAKTKEVVETLERAYKERPFTVEEIRELQEATGLSTDQIRRWNYDRKRNGKPKATRVGLTDNQWQRLSEEFHKDGREWIPVEERQALAEELGLSQEKILHWTRHSRSRGSGKKIGGEEREEERENHKKRPREKEEGRKTRGQKREKENKKAEEKSEEEKKREEEQKKKEEEEKTVQRKKEEEERERREKEEEEKRREANKYKGMCEYEIQRAKRIEENNRFLEMLQLPSLLNKKKTGRR
ncbi:IQ calmodulin-binding motif domain-containing protein [Planoprotostelium fungivorum]|uniref:IQ calmodulin-binding motif domain-containing protein n=1 Tax=Planoprotostelium fungivorum TaxID=1890364 RepID=A0A2P6MW57_9EUKA|nr:IQ calmodulin-binding motif domain-containing protein [Planoprotostelium fungivorum]